MPFHRAVAVTLIAACVAARAQDRPRVVRLQPANQDVEVDASTVTELVVKFDQPMVPGSYSFCGGGPSFPPVPPGKKAQWRNTRTCVLPVALQPGHTYRLSVNCSAAQGFRSAKGVPVSPTPWSFMTLPADLPDPRRQKALNKKAADQLEDVLASSYSYYDLRHIAWGKLFRQHRRELLGARTTVGWAARAAAMLRPTEDLHLYLRFDDSTFATGRRAVDPLFRRELLDGPLGKVHQESRHCLTAMAEGGIGYLMVSTWSHDLDPAVIDGVLERMLAAEPKAMIVDVRPNSGGDELLAQGVAAWFVAGTVVYAKDRYRTGKGKNGFGPVLERSLHERADGKRFEVPIAVLTSRYVMSSCEAFVLMLRQAADCVQIGQPTYGSSGNPKPHELPNGVTVLVPSWQAMRPDGTCFEGEGIAPDIAVEVDPAELSRHDPILERALAVLRKKIE